MVYMNMCFTMFKLYTKYTYKYVCLNRKMFVFMQFINIFMVNGGMKKLEMFGQGS